MTTSVLAFRAGGSRWAVPLERVREAARLRNLTPLPGSPPQLLGVTLVRGEPFGVIDVTPAGSRGRPSPETVLLVLAGLPHAIAADAVDGIEEIPAERLGPPPPGSRRLTALVAEAGGFLSVLDVDALLGRAS